jgi:hypothetical protein
LTVAARVGRLCPNDTEIVERGKVRLFVSHSAETGSARRVLRTLAATLRDAGHDVFVDEVIKPGTPWRSVLYHEIAICDAAVILLDQTSLTKRWVQREVDLLLWRKAFHPGLVIVPIILDTTEIGAVRRAGFGEFTEQQFMTAGQRGWNSATIALELNGLFAGAPDPPSTRMERWFDDIELVLGRVGHPHRLRSAALALGVSAEDADQVLQPGGCRFLAHQFLGRRAETSAVDAIDHLIHCADSETLRQLVALIAPTWVHESAALPLMIHGRTGRFLAVLNARESRTAVEYIRRATCLDAKVRAEQVLGVTGEAGAEDLLAQCEQAVLRLLGGEPELGHSFDDIPAEELRDGLPYARYLIVDVTGTPKAVAAKVIEQIRERFRWLAVVLIVGKAVSTPAAVAELRLADARLLEPPLGEHDEFKAWRTVGDLERMVKSATGGGTL